MSASDQSRLKAAFAGTTLPAYTRAGRNPAVISALSQIERRADKLSERTVAHYKKFEDRWVAKETIRIWQKRLENQARYPAPPGETAKISAEQIAKLAARNVLARTNRRLSRINGIKMRMTNGLVRSLDQPSIGRTFNDAAVNVPKPSRRITP